MQRNHALRLIVAVAAGACPLLLAFGCLAYSREDAATAPLKHPLWRHAMVFWALGVLSALVAAYTFKLSHRADPDPQGFPVVPNPPK